VAITCALLAAFAGFGVSIARAETEPPERESAEILAAHALARAAIMDLKFVGTPAKRDYQVAEEMLAVASRLAELNALNTDPARRGTTVSDQETMLRLYMEAATSADDVAAVRKIVDKLVQLDPNDTVALLRKISAGISDLQTADERLEKYEQFLALGDVLDASIRSRLAVDAALLLRERGDLKGFADKIDVALTLDKTNKDAATLGMAFWSQQISDPVGMLDWKLAVLQADPFDTAVYSSIVDHLLSEGAYKGAWRFAKLHRSHCLNQSKRPSEEEDINYDLAEWNADGPDAVIHRLSDNLEQARQVATDRLKAAIAQGLPSDGMARPEDVRLSMAHERSRVLAAVALHDTERGALFLGELADTVKFKTQDLLDAVRRPKGLDPEDARTRANELTTELTWLRLWTGLQLPDATASVESLTKAGALDPAMAARLSAWTLLRTGDAKDAESALNALPHDPYSLLGLAILAENQDDLPTAVGRYKELARRAPGELSGAFARSRYRSLAKEQIRPTDVAQQLEADIAGSPAWLEEIAANPKKIMSLEAGALHADITPVDRTPVRVTVKNTADFPMAVGPDKPVNSRLMFGPSVEVGTARLPASDLVHVANMDRRLRLNKGESFDVIVYPDIGALSFIAEIGLPRPARIRWRVLQGFELVDQRMYDAGPQCISYDMPAMMRRLPNRSDAVFTALQFALQTGGPREIADAILSIKYQAAQSRLMSQPITPGEVDRLMEVIARRYSTMQKASKILILCLVPSETYLLQAQRIDQLSLQESDEDVVAVILTTRIVKKDDPIFSSPNVLRSPRLAALAQVVHDRLADNVTTYATAAVPVPELIGADAPVAPAQPPKLNLDTGKPGAPAMARPAGPPTPGDNAPVPVLP
jgi:hypothetical protein